MYPIIINDFLDIIRYILLIQVFVAFFVAGGVFFKEHNLRNVTLSLLISLMGFHILLFLYGSGNLGQIYPQFRSWFYYETALLFGPLLFVHLQSFLQNKLKLKLLDLLHLVPILCFWIGYGDVLLIDSSIRGQYINDNFMNRTMIWNYLLVVQMGFYAIVCSIILYAKYKHLSNEKLQYALFLVLAYVCSTILISYLTHYADGWRDFAFYYVILTLLIFGIGYFLFRHPNFLNQIRKKYFGSTLSKSDMLRIKTKIEYAFNTEKLFLKNDLSILNLAKHIGEKTHHVSQTFTQDISESFNDYVNKHRIEIAKKYLLDDKYSHYKVEAIGLESGFNNKVTFYKAFAKFVNLTPAAFRKQKTG